MWLRTNAILLSSSPIGESDLLLIFFTEKLGKIKAIAKGALKSQKRFLGILLNLNQLEIELLSTHSGELGYLLNLASLVKSRLSLSQNPERLASAYALSELIEKSLPELEPEPILFELLESGLDGILEARDFEEQIFYYLLRFLEQLGYLPSLDFCAICGKKLLSRQSRYFFSISKGGFTCESCRKKSGKSLREIPAGFAQALRAIRRLSPGRPGRIRLSPKDWNLGIELFNDFIAWQMEKPLSSLNFLRQMESAQVPSKDKAGPKE